MSITKNKKKCNHHYRDFDWYVTSETIKRGGPFHKREIGIIYLKEPYVCIHCGDRKDVTLAQWEVPDLWNKKYKIKDICSLYHNKISDLPEIEDQINDMLLVDEEYLNIWNQVTGK